VISAPVTESSQVAHARSRASGAATAIGLGEVDAGRAALVATEMATNLIKHGGGGELLIGSYEDRTGAGLELIALDRGRGILNLQSSLQDGFSSSGTAGHGLGAIRRQSQVMEVVSWPNRGTAVLSRISRDQRSHSAGSLTAPWSCISIAKPGEEVCGDGWAAVDTPAGRTLLVVDGLGHGAGAAAAATEAVRLFQRHASLPVADILDYLHAGLRATRGAAVAIARIEVERARVVYGGIGNIAAAVIADGQLRRMISMSGTAGHVARRIQTFDYPYAGGLVIMYSDGLSTSWTLDAYPGLMRAHPSLIAAVLYRDYARRRDDATVLAATGADV
jgi:anti-sigma regulatory factor (Ser/Thr protein kinase)